MRVIVGNPPYSVGQKNANDDNQNEHYPALEQRLRDTYIKEITDVSNVKGGYDSYRKAFRWASDKIGDSGVIAFISNAGWIEAGDGQGMSTILKATKEPLERSLVAKEVKSLVQDLAILLLLPYWSRILVHQSMV